MASVCGLLLLASVAAAQYLSPTVAGNKNANTLNIGLIGPFAPGASAMFWGHPGGLGWAQAIDEINARTDILPNHKIVGWYNSSDADMGTAVAAANEQVLGIHFSFHSSHAPHLSYALISMSIYVPQFISSSYSA